jgi:hypothetical protein
MHGSINIKRSINTVSGGRSCFYEKYTKQNIISVGRISGLITAFLYYTINTVPCRIEEKINTST